MCRPRPRILTRFEAWWKTGETKTKSRFSHPVTVKTTKTLKLPKVSGACKTYAYYDAVTDKTSPAYAVLNSGTYRGVTYKTTTDETTGIRMVGEYYCAALAPLRHHQGHQI